ncbi:MAG TPA: roadblock/LC7 domain-containing protein [Thermoplasmata archaeon]|nr:roadblock/LC7 domain-containing protein [Thermoplasmata archaeon]
MQLASSLALEALKELRNNPKIKASAMVSKDGLVIASDVPPGVYVDTFSIMCATILGAAATADSELKLSPPKRIVVSAEDGNIIILNAGRKTLAVLVTTKDADPDKIVEESQAIIAKVAS